MSRAVLNTVTASVAPDFVNRILDAAKGYSKWVKETEGVSAYHKYHPNNDPDEVVLDLNETLV